MSEALIVETGSALLRGALAGLMPAAVGAGAVDVSDVGVSPAWLIFGFAAQAVFMARFIIQWIASERAGRSVVPTAFWVVSLLGGISLGIYFLRRGDPVGVAGQSLGIFIYLRNLIFIRREREQTRRIERQALEPRQEAAQD